MSKKKENEGKEKEELHPQLQAIITEGIKIRTAVFHEPVRASGKSAPESELHCAETHTANEYAKNRLARMWYTPHTMLVMIGAEFILVPTSNVKYARPV